VTDRSSTHGSSTGGSGADGSPTDRSGAGPFRTEVRAWFAEHTPAGWGQHLDRCSREESLAFHRGWLATLNQRGFGAPHVAPEWGGGGYGLAEQATIYEEWARARAPQLNVFVVSLHHVPATLLDAGTAEQREMVRDALRGTVWCQGFSEPDAGSDLASLRTRAIRDGGDWVVSGQKVWSSHADVADWCLLLARSVPDVPKHQGISYFVLDMHAPGVSVRPIRQSTGHSEFCAIHLDDVRIPGDRIIGQPGQGWAIAQRTLSTERGPIAMGTIAEVRVGVQELAALVDARWPLPAAGTGPLDEAHGEVARLVARAHALRALGIDVVDAVVSGRERQNLASVVKVASSELLRRLTDAGTLLAGDASLLEPGHHAYRGYVSGHWTSDWVNSWGWSIASGTNEIQRTIIAERVLGLPRERRS
jgi:alkylation response protein AidB-like acyl-CoA dehydrogenase